MINRKSATCRGKESVPGDARDAALYRVKRNMLFGGSIEMVSPPGSLEEAHEVLPPGMRIFVPSLPRRSILQNLGVLRKLRDFGFEPVPHIAARRIQSDQELSTFLKIATASCGVTTVFLVGGDLENRNGPFADAQSLLRYGCLGDFGIQTIGVAGYPEAHPRIPEDILRRSLDCKVEVATKLGMDTFLVTQFSLAANQLISYCRKISRTASELRVLVGIPGPTTSKQLFKYAKLCGVKTTFRTLMSAGAKSVTLGMQATSDKQLDAVARYCLTTTNSNVVGVHLFSFGGFNDSVHWIGKHSNPNI